LGAWVGRGRARPAPGGVALNLLLAAALAGVTACRPPARSERTGSAESTGLLVLSVPPSSAGRPQVMAQLRRLTGSPENRGSRAPSCRPAGDCAGCRRR